MADGDNQQPQPGVIDPRMIDQIMSALTPQQPTPQAQPVDMSQLPVTSLLGLAVGGGPQTGMSQADATSAGNRALLNFGVNMLAASGYSPIRRTFGETFAQGVKGAEESLASSQAIGAAQKEAQQQYTQQQIANRAEALKTGMSMQELQLKLAQLRASAGMPNPLATTTTPTAPAGTTPGTTGSGTTLAPFVASNLPQGVSTAEDQAVRTVIGEAGNQPLTGQQAVAYVIKNRMGAGNQSAQDVIFSPNQFEPWNNPKTRASLEAIDPSSKQYQDILNNVVRPVMGGKVDDPTKGATYFYSPTAQAALGRNAPSWAQGAEPTVIGAHNFYRLPYGSPQAPSGGKDTAGQPLIIGDSLASGPGLGGTGTVGAQPSAIRAEIAANAGRGTYNGRDVVLSSGASNAPGDTKNIEAQLQALTDPKGGNAKSVTLMGVGPGVEGKNPGTNAALQALADKYGARFVPLPAGQMSGDGVHPTGQGYATLRGQIVPPAPPAPVQVAGPGVPTDKGTTPPAPPAQTTPTPPAPGTPPAPTTTGPVTPAPQLTTKQPGDDVPDDKLTFQQFKARHMPQPTPEERATFTLPQDQEALANANKAMQAAAQQLQAARSQFPPNVEAGNKALGDYQTAQHDLATTQAAVAARNADAEAKWRAGQDTILAGQYKDAKDRAAELEKMRVQAGITVEQKGAEAGLADAQQQLTDMGKNATEARTVGNQLRLMPSIIDQLPQPGFAAQLAKDHPALVPYMVRAGALSPEQADATQVMQGLIGYMSVGLRPTGSGALRNAEMDRFQQVLPSLMQSPQGRRDSQSLLQTMQDRIVAEHEFASKYFRRIDPATGKPAYNLDGLGDAMDAPKSQGGLGDIAPTGPNPVTTDANGQARRMSPAEVQQWVHSNVGEGHAYWGWAPVGDGTYKPKLMVRRDNG